MLTFRFLNVGHGASVVIDYDRDGKHFFGVIDSNCNARSMPKALTYLSNSGVKELSFVALSHPHDDHFSGLFNILKSFEGNIAEFYTFPLGQLVENRPRYKKLQEQLWKLLERTDSDRLRQTRLELIQIIRWADENHRAKRTVWRECDGELNIIAPDGFIGVTVSTIAPPKSSKANWLHKIDTGEFDRPGTLDLNDLSVAFCFKICEVEVIIGGDATKLNWEAKRRFEQR
jgi:hypothetical protein